MSSKHKQRTRQKAEVAAAWLPHAASELTLHHVEQVMLVSLISDF
jgi:hypothetical protein